MKTWRHVQPRAWGWEPFREAWLAECSLAAYEPRQPSSVRMEAAFADMRGFAFSESCQGFAAWSPSPGYAVLAFRGTDSAEDWRADSDHALVAAHWCHGRVHRGFAGALAAGWPGLLALLDLVPEGLPLLVAGHSLGGALAVLAAARLRAEGRPGPVRVATYGQPKVGDARFSRISGPANWVRVALRDDPIPLLPPSPNLLRRYAHGGALAWIGPDGTLDDSSGAASRHERLARLPDARDHSAAEYCLALEARLPTPHSAG